VRGRGEQERELVLGQPVGFLLWLRRRLELEERVGQPADLRTDFYRRQTMLVR
jgi:hypothetical protein